MRVFSEEERRAFLASLDKTPKGSNVVIETADGRLLTLKANYKEEWCLPGGWCDEGESPRACAAREVAEETALTVAPEQLELVAMMHRTSTMMRSDLYIWRCTTTLDESVAIAIQPEEIDAYAFVTKQEVLENSKKYNHQVRAWANDFPERYCEFSV